MLKAVAWTTVIAGSLSAVLACSSKSSGGNGFEGSGSDASNSEGEDGSGSSSSDGSSSGSCSNPLAELSALGITPPASCEPCLMTSCNDGGSWAACATESCTACSQPLITCATTGVCSSACVPTLPDSGTTIKGDVETVQVGDATVIVDCDAGASACSTLMTCCTTIMGLESFEPSLTSLVTECTSIASSGSTCACGSALATYGTYCGAAGH